MKILMRKNKNIKDNIKLTRRNKRKKEGKIIKDKETITIKRLKQMKLIKCQSKKLMKDMKEQTKKEGTEVKAGAVRAEVRSLET